MPGIVAAVLDSPKRRPAYCGAMSTWLTRTPANWKPDEPRATVRKATAQYGCSQVIRPVMTRKRAGKSMPGRRTGRGAL